MTTGRVQIMVRTEDRSPNMPSLARMLEVLRSRDGMDVPVPAASVRITGCPRMGALPDHYSITGTQECPADQTVIDTCPTC